MQNRVDPLSRASRAARKTLPRVTSFEALRPVLWRDDWAQYEQSSVQPPVLMLRSVHSWTFDGSLNLRWTVLLKSN